MVGEVVEAFLGGFVCGFEVLGDLVEGLADSGVVATDHCCVELWWWWWVRSVSEAVVCDEGC